MPIVTLVSDFGTKDAYVGTMKGVVLSVNPAAVIIDITHHIEPQNLTQAAYIIPSVYKYFPENTVHIIVIDPGVGGDRAVLAAKINKHIFLAPDNGVLTLLWKDTEVDAIIRVENTRFFLKPVSQTFHGRDIFAPVGAYLSKGIDIRTFGPTLHKKDVVHLRLNEPYINENHELVGAVVFVDRFGNCVTNIDESRLNKLRETEQDNRLEIIIGEKRINGLSHSYCDVEPRNPLAVVGSCGYLEIAVNGGNAKNYFNIQAGDTIRMSLKHQSG